MNEEDLKNLKDLRFTFTKEMQEMIDKLLSMRYILDNEKLSNRKKAKLEKEFSKLLLEFKKELHYNNPVQIKIIHNYLQNKKEIQK